MAALELLAAAAGAAGRCGRVPANRARSCSATMSHDLRGGATGAQQLCHDLHVGIDVPEEVLVAGAQVVEAVLSIGRAEEPVARALAVAGEADLAIAGSTAAGRRACRCRSATCWGEAISSTRWVSPMLPSRWSGSTKWSQEYRSPLCSRATAVPQVSRNTHIAGCMPSQEARAASKWPTNTSPTSLRTHSSNTAARNRPHCSAPTDRSVTRLPVLRYSGRSRLAPAPAGVGDGQGLLVGALHDGDELHEPQPEVVAEAAVHLEGAVGVGRVDRAQHVDVHPMGPQDLEAREHPVEGAPARLVDPVDVVQLPGPVDGQADQETVRGQELPPAVVEEHPVGLEGELHLLVGPCVPAGELHHPLVEGHAQQGGLASLDGQHHLRVPGGSRGPGGRRPPAPPRPSGTGRRGRAAPWTGRSSTCSRGCRWHPRAWP